MQGWPSQPSNSQGGPMLFGWFTEIRPPFWRTNRCTACIDSESAQRKSIHSRSPHMLAWPQYVVTSSPGISVIGKWERRERSSWWVFVLWSVTARKSSPRSIALATSSSTVFNPSEWIVWQWRSPFSQRAGPALEGGARPLLAGGGSASLAGSYAGGGSRSSRVRLTDTS